MANNIPEVRFEGFSGEWEERKLGEVFNQTVEYVNPSKSNLELWSVTVQNGLTPKTDRYNRDALVKKNDKFKIVHSGEIVYNPMNITIGAVGFNSLNKSVAVSGYYVTMNMNEGFSNSYFGTWLISANAIKKYKLYATGSLIEKQRVQFSTLSSIKVHIPSLEEQTQIGSFFKQLDDTIALQQQELDILKQTKQGFLQKMFPKEGETVPELRFPGFSGAWEERKLGEHSEILTGGTPKTSITSYWEPKEVPWMSSGEVNKHRLDSTDNMISLEGLKNSSARWVKPYSILIALAGQGKTRGTVAINNVAITTNQSIAAIEPNKSLHYEFVYQNLVKRYEELRMISSGDGTRGGLNKQIIADVIITSPNIEEQTKIGSFFKQLDDTIALHEQELDALKETKKAFLQKMFV
ncbi:restriction endonuclease subunit S [Kurthia senegalensis]|uniref:restriction endonuclease subunit S n=1 Tax=Kurthia senegalensis TaxID=1033740 RepID=UPI000288E973|nr:restriction endonuclease subunit S [Kurthia senegalensis]